MGRPFGRLSFHTYPPLSQLTNGEEANCRITEVVANRRIFIPISQPFLGESRDMVQADITGMGPGTGNTFHGIDKNDSCVFLLPFPLGLFVSSFCSD